MVLHASRLGEPVCLRALEDVQGASVASGGNKWMGSILSLAFVESVAVTGCCLKHPAPVTGKRIRGDIRVPMEKPDWVAQTAMGCARSRAALAQSRALDKLRMVFEPGLRGGARCGLSAGRRSYAGFGGARGCVGSAVHL